MSCELFVLNQDFVEAVVLVFLILVFQFVVYPRMGNWFGSGKSKKRFASDRRFSFSVVREARRVLKYFLLGLVIKNTRIRPVVLAVVLVLLVDGLYIISNQNLTFSLTANVQSSVFSGILLHPYWEEFLMRGFSLGAIIAFVQVLCFAFKERTKFSDSTVLYIQSAMVLFTVFITGLFFGLAHKSLIVVFGGILYGILFLGDDFLKLVSGSKREFFGSRNNLLPPIAAHMAHNLLIALIVCL